MKTTTAGYTEIRTVPTGRVRGGQATAGSLVAGGTGVGDRSTAFGVGVVDGSVVIGTEEAGGGVGGGQVKGGAVVGGDVVGVGSGGACGAVLGAGSVRRGVIGADELGGPICGSTAVSAESAGVDVAPDPVRTVPQHENNRTSGVSQARGRAPTSSLRLVASEPSLNMGTTVRTGCDTYREARSRSGVGMSRWPVRRLPLAAASIVS